MYSKLQDGSFIICGYVARDAEQKTTQNGKTLTRWSVAVGKKQGQNGQTESIWTNCQAWDKAAEVAAQIKKGDTVFCIGRIETNEYQGKTYKNLVCEYVSIMGKSAAPPPPASAQEGISAEDDLSEFEELLSDDEVPF